MTFLGLIGIMHPPGPEVKAAIETCQRRSIQVKMITGDQAMTAAAIGNELDITNGTEAPLDGKQLSALSDEELAEVSQMFPSTRGVTPDQKMRIVSAARTR